MYLKYTNKTKLSSSATNNTNKKLVQAINKNIPKATMSSIVIFKAGTKTESVNKPT